ncbi:run domain Beclin-1-interacting and cysteine-rich domain-containing protein-like isoform X2 [Dendronephthya gigantea]|uniref:run domain Beclin-1-interacting and cysteine-rich domain-containing protein-like isoform X2 n=1 Tax=Dendronephthya gigantea TaxID=151771 RepID=UPI00106BD75E|nr:run domain Beclin-1-interacting and cysteine-rich domain-containing protein-like isoform X2 [Dendronephthya gigantea]
MADNDEESELRHAAERCDILLKIKSTIDGLLASGSHITWSTYGGLARISDNVEQVLTHGSRIVVRQSRNKLGATDLLSCLIEISRKRDSGEDNINSVNQWIQKSLLNHTLSRNLVAFTNKKKRIKKYYYKFAFLRSISHFQALQHCLRAIEEDNPLLPTTIDYTLLNKERYLEVFRKKFCDHGSLNDDNSSCDSMSENDEPDVRSDRVPSTASNASSSQGFQKDRPSVSEDPELPSLNDGRDEIFVPKSSRLSITQKTKPKFDETVLATAAFTAATEPVDVQNEVRWFEGGLPTKPYEDGNTKTLLRNAQTESERLLRRPSKDSISSNSTIESLTFDSRNNEGQNTTGLSEHDKKKKLGHYRSKSDQFHRFRPFGTTRQPFFDDGGHNGSKSNNADTFSTSLPTNSDVAEFYGSSLGLPHSSRSSDNPVLGFLSSREYDSCQEFDRENAHFSISEALICAIEQMKYESGYSDLVDDDDGESDEEIKQLRAEIRKKKLARKQSKKEETVSSSSKTGTSISSGSPGSSFSSKEISKSVDSDYNSSSELASPESNNLNKRVEKQNMIPSKISLDTSSPLETSGSPISAEQVALCLLEKVASRKNLTSEDLKWMVSEHDVPQSLLPLPTAVPVSPDDELYDTTENFSRRTSLPCRLRGNLEWAPPRQQIIFSIPSNPKRKEAMTKQGYRCAGCGMRVEPGYVKKLRYCNYLGKYFCYTCRSSTTTVIPGRIIQRWDFKEYEVSTFARDLLSRVHNDPLFNIQAINKTLYKKVKEIDGVKHLRLQLHYLASFLRTCRYAVKLLELINALPNYIMDDIHLYSIRDLLEVKSGVFRERLEQAVNSSLDHVSTCQLCLAKGFVCEYCKNGEDIIYPFEVKRCSQCPDCGSCYHRECFVEGKCPKCERLLLRKKAAEVFNFLPDEDEFT